MLKQKNKVMVDRENLKNIFTVSAGIIVLSILAWFMLFDISSLTELHREDYWGLLLFTMLIFNIFMTIVSMYQKVTDRALWYKIKFIWLGWGILILIILSFIIYFALNFTCPSC